MFDLINMKRILLLMVLLPTVFLVASSQRTSSMKEMRRQASVQRRQKQIRMQKVQKRMLPPYELDFSKLDEEANNTHSNVYDSSIDGKVSSVDGQSDSCAGGSGNGVGATPEHESYGFGSGGSGPGNAGNKNKASNIAIKAAEEAKSASDAQAGAAEAAARQVKAHLADKAMTAAKAAEAALSGKQQIVEQLEQEVREAEIIVQEETDSLQVTHNNADASMLASKQAGLQLKTLTTAVKIAQENVCNAETAAKGAAQEFNEKTKLVEAAKSRVELLLRQLSAARSDFVSTKKAAHQASSAAQEAKLKASRD